MASYSWRLLVHPHFYSLVCSFSGGLFWFVFPILEKQCSKNATGGDDTASGHVDCYWPLLARRVTRRHAAELSLLAARCSLLAAPTRCSLSLLAAHWSLLASRCSLLTDRLLLLASHFRSVSFLSLLDFYSRISPAAKRLPVGAQCYMYVVGVDRLVLTIRIMC